MDGNGKAIRFMLNEESMELNELIDGNCYHICTNGQDTPLLMRSEDDFRTACVYLALLSWKLNVSVLAYIVMSNHVHVLVACRDRMQAEKFIKAYKQKLSIYLRRKYGMGKPMKGVTDSITLVDSLKYFQNCVAYILRNALCAKVCMKLEGYQWSSYSAYFADDNLACYKMIKSLGARERKRMLNSRDDLRECPYCLDAHGRVVNRSFVRYDIVEAAFKNSCRSFLYFLGTCNDAKMEYELTVKPQTRVGDIEMVKVIEQLVASRFNGKTLADLTLTNKCSIVKAIYFNNKTSIPQLSRLLGLPRDVVAHVLGC